MRPAEISRFAVAVAVAVAALGAAVGCNGGECGPGEAPPDGVTVTVGAESVSFGGFSTSPNNDCPRQGHPTSVTITGSQVQPQPAIAAFLTFCVATPDRIGSGPIELAGEDTVEVVDVQGDLDGCRLRRDRTRSLTGTIRFAGYCDDGLDPAGYAIELAAEVPGIRSCPDGDDEEVTIELTGQAAVAAE
jgi:hypothetical protein